MFEEIDYKKAVLDFTAQNLDKFYAAGKGLLKGAANLVRLRLDRSYNDYLTSVWKRYSGVRSFFNRNESLEFYKLYVPISLIGQDSYILDPIALKIASTNPFAVISGSGSTATFL